MTHPARAQRRFQVWSRSDNRRPTKVLHITLAGDPQYAEAYFGRSGSARKSRHPGE